MQTLRDFVEARRASDTPFCIDTESLAVEFGLDTETATAELEALAAEGRVTRRTSTLCLACGQRMQVEDDPESTPTCTFCSERGAHPAPDPHTVVTWSAPGTTIPEDVGELLTGPELDALVAGALGVVSCTEWETSFFGGLVGDILVPRCQHAFGACYSNRRPPHYTRSHHLPARLTLRDLPPGSTLTHDEDRWSVTVPGVLPAPSTPTEAHALALALLHCAKAGRLTPRFTEETRWKAHWPKAAVARGVTPDPPTDAASLPAPWTPRRVLALDDLLRNDEAEAKWEEGRRLEETRPLAQRTSYGHYSRHDRNPDDVVADLLSAGVPPSWLDNTREQARERGRAKAMQNDAPRTEQPSREEDA